MAYTVQGGRLVFTSSQSRPHGARRRGDWNRRILTVRVVDGVEMAYHATKGWRVRRTDAPAGPPAFAAGLMAAQSNTSGSRLLAAKRQIGAL